MRHCFFLSNTALDDPFREVRSASSRMTGKGGEAGARQEEFRRRVREREAADKEKYALVYVGFYA